MEPKNIDYLVCGHPDVSYHGVKTWCPEFENFRRQLGILYCGEYGRRADGTSDDYFFVAYNMHWEPHEFDLPKLPKGMKWTLCINTDDATITDLSARESLEAGRSRRKSFVSIWFRRGLFWIFRSFKANFRSGIRKGWQESRESGKIGKTGECQKRTGKGSGDCGCGSARTVRTELKEDKAS